MCELCCFRLPHLPLKSMAFLSETQAVGGGYDGELLLFCRCQGSWKFMRTLQGEGCGSVLQKEWEFQGHRAFGG